MGKIMKSKKSGLKILAAGDIHGDIGLARQLAEKAKKEKVDLVILCGDLTYAETRTDNLIKPFVDAGKKVLVIPGNHETLATVDFWTKIYGKNKVKNLHGYGLKFKDVGIFGCGSANMGLFQLSEPEIYSTLKKGYEQIKNAKTKIMITHVHPSDTLMSRMTTIFPGSTGVRKAIEKFHPQLSLCSHVHEAAGIEEKVGDTKVINVGRKGKIIRI